TRPMLCILLTCCNGKERKKEKIAADTSERVETRKKVDKLANYFYMPKPRHRRPSRLLRLLGPSFDPFWMSIDQPSEEKFNLSSSELRDAAASHRQKLEKEAAELDLSSLPSDVSNSVRSWLVRSATCDLHYRWVDLGPTFWPRWLRQTDCEQADGEKSCSFPGGMKCVRAQTTHIKILAWHCIEIRDGSRGIKEERSDGSKEMETGEALKRCLWRQIPYPVVTVCVCSC
uniref:Noggin n=1 Tax=Stegastes partitus TaxID=144197 RepID=A0A3B4ZNK6_9TELE